MDLAHQLAFRRGLGNSLFASPYVEVDLHSATAFARSSFANTNGLAVLATGGLSDKVLSDLVGQFYVGSSSSASSSSPAAVQPGSKSDYYGGEMRIPATGHAHSTIGHLVVGFQGGSHSAPEFAVLKALLGGEAATKWGTGTQPFAKLSNLSTYTPSVRAFNLAYSDAGLFGFTIDAKTEKIADLAKEAVSAVQQVAEKGVSDEEIKRAVARAKFEAATALEGRVTKQEVIGAQVSSSDSSASTVLLHFADLRILSLLFALADPRVWKDHIASRCLQGPRRRYRLKGSRSSKDSSQVKANYRRCRRYTQTALL